MNIASTQQSIQLNVQYHIPHFDFRHWSYFINNICFCLSNWKIMQIFQSTKRIPLTANSTLKYLSLYVRICLIILSSNTYYNHHIKHILWIQLMPFVTSINIFRITTFIITIEQIPAKQFILFQCTFIIEMNKDWLLSKLINQSVLNRFRYIYKHTHNYIGRIYVK